MSTAMPLAPPVAVPTMTAEEFYDWSQRPENVDRLFELEQGKVVEMSRAGKYHGFVCGNSVRILSNYGHQRKRGYPCSNDAGVVLERGPDTVRGPDVAWYDDEQTAGDMERRYPAVLPKLVIEVMSPNDRFNKMVKRIAQMLRAGIAMGWLIDPEGRDISVYRPGREPEVFTEEQELTCDDVLPGFRCSIADFFAVPGN